VSSGNDVMEGDAIMSAGGILLTFASVCLGVSLILALLFHFWPRYGSVAEAIAQTDRVLDEMERAASEY
jgi:hypothetical protein